MYPRVLRHVAERGDDRGRPAARLVREHVVAAPPPALFVAAPRAPAAGMRVRRLPPAADLVPLVRRYVVIEQPPGPPLRLPMIAWSKLRLVIHLEAPTVVRMAGAERALDVPSVGGFVSSPFEMQILGAMRVFFVEFTELGFFALFGDVGADLLDRVTDLWALLPDRWRRDLVSELRAATRDEARCEAVERMIRQFVPGDEALRRGRHVAHAIAHVRAGGTPPTVRQLAREVGVSEPHLGRAFRSVVGVSPKRWLSAERARRAFHLVRRDSSRSGADVAQAAGYFDQAHLIRDLRRYTGQTPTALRDDAFAFAEEATR